MSYKELIKELLQELKERSINCFGDRLYSLVVFGSVASGLNTPESDVDVIYILKNFRGSYEEFSLYYRGTPLMVNISLADSYYRRAKIRAEILKEFVKREDFADRV